MILAIDGYEANAGGRVGVGRYAFELLTRMARMVEAGSAPFSSVRVYVPQGVSSHMPPETQHWQYRRVGIRPLWTFLGLPFSLLTETPKADVVFSPTHYAPRFIGIPKVIAIMDVSYLHYPELFRASDLHKLVNWTRDSVRRAAKIITISQFSKRAIIEAYHVREDDVVVAYPALPDSVGNHMGDTPGKPLISGQYILSVGTLQPRKNYARLIEAFGQLKDKDVTLVIVGKKGWLFDEILAAPAKFGIADRVKFLDYVGDAELGRLYDGAVAFALPSLYEGFGLPVLEAMAHGIPAVVSRTSSLPEIAGDAGIYVDPERVESIVEGLEKALSEKGDERKKRVNRGKALSRNFRWDTAAATVMEALQSVSTKG